MEEKKLSIEITQEECMDLLVAVESYKIRSLEQGYGAFAYRYVLLMQNVIAQIKEQGGLEV